MKEVCMEDVNDMALKSSDIILEDLKEYKIELTDEQQDEIYLAIRCLVEKYCGCPDYRHHH